MHLGPLKIPDQPNGVKVTTESGEDLNTKANNIVQNKILPSRKNGLTTFDGKQMWQSGKSRTGLVSIEVTFPFEVELTRIAVHSQHSGEYHPALAVRAAVKDAKGRFQKLTETDLKTVDAMVKLPKTKGKVWQFDFRAGPTGIVALRGLQFYTGDDEIFPALIPYQP
ncbi:MAG: hypothetical protein ACRC8S_02935 [Fimbriiglobus sp.]